MNRLIIVAMCLAGGLAMAQENDEKQPEGQSEETNTRIAKIEQIIVTAKKEFVQSSEEFDSEIESILEDADVLENEE